MSSAEKKAVFFDIDGTLLDFKNYIPESTREAVRRLRENGHLAFLCSGRCRGYIRRPELLSIGFDGIVSGCGTMVEYRGETLFYREIPADTGIRTVETLKKYRVRAILEGRHYLYFDHEDFDGDRYGDKLRAELGEDVLPILGEHWGKWEFSKFSCDLTGSDSEPCMRELSDYYDFIVHNAKIVEAVPKGFDKAAGMRWICGHLGIPMEHTVAFGDSVNDLEMLAAAGTGVAMGGCSERVAEQADLVTDTLYADGIWKACEKLELIG